MQMKIKLLEVKEAKGEKIITAEDIFKIMPTEAKADRECLWAVHLNARNKIIEKELVAMGIVNSCPVQPREIFKKAIMNGAVGIIIVHNHPSGENTPSEDDITLWKRLIEAGKILGIPVMDFIIITWNGYYSLESNLSHTTQKIMKEIDELSLRDFWEFKEKYCQKNKLVYISEPSIVIEMSKGEYIPCWLIPGYGLCDEGSLCSEKFPKRDRNLFRKLEILIHKNQEYLLGEKGMEEYRETAEDRKLVEILGHGGKMDPETGIIRDPITGEEI